MSILFRTIVATVSLGLSAAATSLGAQGSAAGPSSGADAPLPPRRTGVSALREAGLLCVFDPAERRKLRELSILTEPATGDTFAAPEPGSRPLPLGLLYSSRRNYVGSRPWFGSDVPLTFAGRGYRREGAPVVLPMAEMRPVGTTADVWLFERSTAADAEVLYVPSGPGCEFQPYRAVSPPVRGGRASWGLPPHHLRLGYMTDRRPTADAHPGRHYDAEQGPVVEGAADVVITARHQVGRIESRVLFGGGTDTLSHIVLLRLEDPAPRASGRRALLYIHGFLNTFEDAARRAAQLAEDLDFDGDAYFFSWPSRGRLTAYGIDELAVQRSRADFAAVLSRLLDAYGAGNVSVIAHSLGNRGFASAVADLRSARPGKLFDQVVLASPDQDFMVFRDFDIEPVKAAAHRVTVYSSPADRALFFIRAFVGGRRAGDDPLEVAEIAGIDVIDTSSSSSGVARHSDYAESQAVLGDLFLLLRGRTPEQRALKRVQANQRSYWTFR